MPSAWQQNWNTSGKKALSPRDQNWLLGEWFHISMVFLWAGLEESAEQVWVLGAGAWSAQGGWGSTWVTPVPKGGTCHPPGWPQDTRLPSSGHTLHFQQQESPFPSSTIPPQQHQKGKREQKLVLETWNRFPKACWRQCPAVESSPAVQQLAVPAGNSRCSAGAARDPAQAFPNVHFSGTSCGNPDKIEELSWQGMGFSHTLPEGLHFLSHPTLLA